MSEPLTAGSSGSTKRRRTRGFIACDACQRRKSRCEMLDSEGCHRCMVLQTPCSLVGQQSAVMLEAATSQVGEYAPLVSQTLGELPYFG